MGHIYTCRFLVDSLAIRCDCNLRKYIHRGLNRCCLGARVGWNSTEGAEFDQSDVVCSSWARLSEGLNIRIQFRVLTRKISQRGGKTSSPCPLWASPPPKIEIWYRYAEPHLDTSPPILAPCCSNHIVLLLHVTPLYIAFIKVLYIILDYFYPPCCSKDSERQKSKCQKSKWADQKLRNSGAHQFKPQAPGNKNLSSLLLFSEFAGSPDKRNFGKIHLRPAERHLILWFALFSRIFISRPFAVFLNSRILNFCKEKTDFIIISPPWYDPGCCWGVKPQ